jgi:hypothetical protein
VSSIRPFFLVLTRAPTAELCFWLFVVKAGPTQRDWFSSLYFKMWMIGSSIAILYMPFVTIFTRADPLKVLYRTARHLPTALRIFQRKHVLILVVPSKCEAYTFLAGSLGSLSITLWFLPVL